MKRTRIKFEKVCSADNNKVTNFQSEEGRRRCVFFAAVKDKFLTNKGLPFINCFGEKHYLTEAEYNEAIKNGIQISYEHISINIFK